MKVKKIYEMQIHIWIFRNTMYLRTVNSHVNGVYMFGSDNVFKKLKVVKDGMFSLLQSGTL